MGRSIVVVCALLAGCGGESGLDDSGEAEIIAAAREGAARVSSVGVQRVHPLEVRVDGACASVVVLESGKHTMTAFVEDDGGWELVDYVTGDHSLRLEDGVEDCWR